jgi:hypothetical protein
VTAIRSGPTRTAQARSGRVNPAGALASAEPGTLEYFLVERYCLYAGDGELRADIHHAPWSLQSAEPEVTHQGIAPVELDGEPICHFARRQDVVVWWPGAYGRA